METHQANDPHATCPPGQPLSEPAGSVLSMLSAAPTISDLPPELTNHPQYEILRELGRGGMGVVYLANNGLLARQEVLKVVNQAVLSRAGGKARFLREMQSAARLCHPNVVTAYSALQTGELLVFAMEYIEGEDLDKHVRNGGPLPVALACSYTQQAALGLQHAFEKQMVHRDIKPENLILSREGKHPVVKVLDFGLAKIMREERQDVALTAAGQMLGTPDFVAPEQALDAARADIRADIYSLGCTLYFLLTGNPPFTGKSLFEVLQAHHSTEARPLNLVRPDLPAELVAVVKKMMAKDPAERYQEPSAVVQALAPFVPAGTNGSSIREPAEPSQRSSLVPNPGSTTARDTVTESCRSITEPEPHRVLRPDQSLPGKLSARKHRLLVSIVAMCGLLLSLVSLWAGGVFEPKPSPAARVPKEDAAIDDQDFVPLFNGQDKTGWKTHPKEPGKWRVEDGILIGSGSTKSHLYSERSDFKDFHLRVKGRINNGGNSGIIFRAPFGIGSPGIAWTRGGRDMKTLTGYEAEIKGWQTGSLFAWPEGTVASVEETLLPPKQWFTMDVIAEGNHIVIKVNGSTTVDYTDPRRRFTVGHIVLQQLWGGTVVEFSEVRIKEFPATQVQSSGDSVQDGS
ncbi:MAG TPA: family 16 glycoside hydrolase [Gemmataceae bacterium]|nr:family 16 glycoside hydrolase [Gemmataceae bacterium]